MIRKKKPNLITLEHFMRFEWFDSGLCLWVSELVLTLQCLRLTVNIFTSEVLNHTLKCSLRFRGLHFAVAVAVAVAVYLLKTLDRMQNRNRNNNRKYKTATTCFAVALRFELRLRLRLRLRSDFTTAFRGMISSMSWVNLWIQLWRGSQSIWSDLNFQMR